jgi:hypothetical protein
LTERIEQFLEDHADGYGAHDYPAVVDALVATGLVSLDRAESWKAEHARLCASRIDYQGRYDEELEAKAIELLEALFAPVRPLAGDEWDPAVYGRTRKRSRRSWASGRCPSSARGRGCSDSTRR